MDISRTTINTDAVGYLKQLFEDVLFLGFCNVQQKNTGYGTLQMRASVFQVRSAHDFGQPIPVRFWGFGFYREFKTSRREMFVFLRQSVKSLESVPGRGHTGFPTTNGHG